MIENISLELNQLFGNDFVIFFENKSDLVDDSEKKLWADKVIGAFYPMSGTFLPMEGVSAFSGQAVLRLLAPSENKTRLRELEYKIQSVIDTNNGLVVSVSDYKYQLVFGNLRPNGNVEITFGAERQPYEIDMTVILASGVQFGSGASVKIDGEKLTGLTLINYDTDNAVEPKLNINKYNATNTAQYNAFMLTCSGFIQDDEIWQKLQNDGIFGLDKSYFVEYSKNGITKSFDGILRKYSETNKIGEFQVASLVFVPTELSEYITVTFDSNGGEWEATDTITVTYSSNGGTGSMVDVNSPYALGANVTILDNEFTRSGYTFVEFNTSPDGTGISYSGGDVITPSASVILYAQWEVAVYTVQYDANGGTGTIPLDLTEYNSGNIVTVKFTPAPTKENYAFEGWAYSAVASTPDFTADGVTTFAISSNVTLYAIYSEYITVTYDGNGGSWTEI